MNVTRILFKQSQLLTQHNKLSTDASDGLAVVFSQVGDGLEVGHQTPGQPHQLDVALGFSFQAPARLKAVQITVDTDLQQSSGVVSQAKLGVPARWATSWGSVYSEASRGRRRHAVSRLPESFRGGTDCLSQRHPSACCPCSPSSANPVTILPPRPARHARDRTPWRVHCEYGRFQDQ